MHHLEHHRLGIGDGLCTISLALVEVFACVVIIDVHTLTHGKRGVAWSTDGAHFLDGAELLPHGSILVKSL